jgi:hypothetical protein
VKFCLGKAGRAWGELAQALIFLLSLIVIARLPQDLLINQIKNFLGKFEIRD